ncbi:MAG: pyrroline-5-carboxylate reductase [Pseudomonadota bacterium]
MLAEGPVLLVGCGRMGGAMLDGWLAQGAAPERIVVVEPNPAGAFHHRAGLRRVVSVQAIEAAFRPAAVVFAVKPQEIAALIDGYRRFVNAGTVFLSILAGKRIDFFEKRLGKEAALVRAMPNTPAAIRRGITVACANAAVDAESRALCQRLLAAVGEVEWVAAEALLDLVTAVSGSGPAYVFLFTECLAKAGIKAGLPAPLAWRLARATVSGSGSLLDQSSEAPEVLRQHVTSPGGTTAAAVDELLADDALEALLERAVAAAVRRSRELGD